MKIVISTVYIFAINKSESKKHEFIYSVLELQRNE